MPARRGWYLTHKQFLPTLLTQDPFAVLPERYREVFFVLKDKTQYEVFAAGNTIYG